jgi:5-oxoprolinase (ATP-hydrolysing) subunit A
VVPFCFCKLVAVTRVDLNADVGESFGAYSIGDDEVLLASITSASIAAGFHGGDPTVLRRTIQRARKYNVRIGAHPGLPDLSGFGRREMRLAAAEAEDLVLYQIAAVAGVARAEGVSLQHVKPHGALYNMAARDSDLAAAIVRAVKAFDPSLTLFAAPNSKLLEAGLAGGLRVAAEAFADRAYESDGTLARRGAAGSVLTDPSSIVARAVRMITEGVVMAVDGTPVPIAVDTLCVHSDTPGAGVLGGRLRDGLKAAGILVQPLHD